MYSPERKEAGEMSTVHDKILYAINLQTTVTMVQGTITRTDSRPPAELLSAWAADIRLDFDSNNMVLSSRAQEGGQEATAAHVHTLSTHIGNLTDIIKTLSVNVASLAGANQAMQQQIQTLESQVKTLSGRSESAWSKFDLVASRLEIFKDLQGCPETAGSTAATSIVSPEVVVANVSLLPLPLCLPALACMHTAPARSIGSKLNPTAKFRQVLSLEDGGESSGGAGGGLACRSKALEEREAETPPTTTRVANPGNRRPPPPRVRSPPRRRMPTHS
jgi:hypothetical protein